MTTQNNNEERLTWNEIKEKYDKQIIGLVNIERDSNNNIVSAIVKYTSDNSTYNERLILAIKGEISLESIGIVD